jgi:tetratricopeptide (TPR) repeat protein
MLVNVVSIETGRNYYNIKKYKAASICYRLASIIDPENKNIHFMLAKIYALDNEPAESLRSLEKAIKLGYDNRQSIEKEPAFIPLKNMKRFSEVLNQIK